MNIFERAIRVIAPHNCLVCNKEGSPVCHGCLYSELSPPPSRCAFCNKLTQNSKTCPACRRLTGINHVWVANEYETLAKKIVKAYKFEKKRELVGAMASSLFAAMPITEAKYLIVPIPTILPHIRERGFDHTALLAKAVAKLSNSPSLSVLRRIDKAKQVGKKRVTRIKSMENTMRITRSMAIAEENVLLIDDVVTTGATLTEAARVLRAAGAKSVSALIFAQA